MLETLHTAFHRILPKVADLTLPAAIAIGTAVGSPIIGGLIGLTLLAGITAKQHYDGQRQNERYLTDFYRDEISKLLDKPKKEVTVADMKALAYGKVPGIPKLTVLEKHLLTRDTQYTNFSIVTAITGVIITAASALAGVYTTGIGSDLIASAGGFLAFRELKPIVGDIYSSLAPLNPRQNTVQQQIQALTLKLDNAISIKPHLVFQVFASADPQLAGKIKEATGREYIDLPYEDKIFVMNTIAPQFGQKAEKFCEALNQGQKRPQELVLSLENIKTYPRHRENQHSPQAPATTQASGHIPSVHINQASLENRLTISPSILSQTVH